MKLLIATIFLIGICSGGCKVSTNDAPVASPGRWQVIQTENNQRNEKQPILLDSYTGETWVEGWDTNKGYIWKRIEKRQ
jgi:hypothetical protein